MIRAFAGLLSLILIVLAVSCSDDDPVSQGDPPPCMPCFVAVSPSMDNTMYEEEDTLSNGAGATMIAGLDGRARIRRALVKFDVASLVPANSVIDSTHIKMTTVSGGGTAVRVWLHRTLRSWGEGSSNAVDSEGRLGAPATPGDATWSHALWPDTTWSARGGDFAIAASGSTMVGGAFVRYTWWSTTEMTADVQGWLDDPATNFGWTLRGEETGVNTDKIFGSREIPTTELAPVLNVYYHSN